jgi:hypothetical protein
MNNDNVLKYFLIVNLLATVALIIVTGVSVIEDDSFENGK